MWGRPETLKSFCYIPDLFCAIKQFSVRTCRDIPDEFECSSACFCGRWSLVNRIRLFFGFVSAEVWILQSHIWRGRPFKNPFWVFKRVMRKEKGQKKKNKRQSIIHVCHGGQISNLSQKIIYYYKYLYIFSNIYIYINICEISSADFYLCPWQEISFVRLQGLLSRVSGVLDFLDTEPNSVW